MSSTITVAGKPCGRIGYGLLGLTALAAPQRPTEEAAIEAIKTAVDAGATVLNSATFYGVEDPLANLKLLNRFFETYPDYVDKTVVVVKGGMKNYQLITDFDALREDAKSAQEALGATKKIDIFEYARLPDDIPIEEVMRRMITLRDEGLFNHIGFSEISGPTLRRAAKVGSVAAVEIELSLWAMEPAILETVAVTKELGIPFQAYSPLGRGILTGKWKSPDDMDKHDRRRMWPRFQGDNFAKNLELVEKVTRLAEKKGVTNSQLALAYILRMSPMILPIPGSSSPERILSNIAAQDVQLTEAEVKEIDDVLASFTVVGDRYPEMFLKDLCDRGSPCFRCSRSDLDCTYLVPAKKKGPEGKTIARIRASQRGSGSRSESTYAYPRSRGSRSPVATSTVSLDDVLSLLSASSGLSPVSTSPRSLLASLPGPAGPAFIQDPGPSNQLQTYSFAPPLVISETVSRPIPRTPHAQSRFLDQLNPSLPDLLQRYFTHIHPLFPTVDKRALITRLAQKDHLWDPSLGALVLSLFSLPLIGSATTGSPETVNRGDQMVRAAQELHRSSLSRIPTLDELAAAAHIASYLRARDGGTAAHLSSKHVIGMLELMKLDKEEGYRELSPREREVALSIYWMTAVGERSNALLSLIPLTLRSPLSSLTSILPALSDSTMRIAPCTMLYECVSPSLIDCINGRCDRGQGEPRGCSLTKESIVLTHAALDAVTLDPRLSLVQTADIVLTRGYLHLKVWQASVSHALLESGAEWDALRVGFPLKVLAQIAGALRNMPEDAIRGNGRAMGAKLSTIADIVQCVLSLPGTETAPDVAESYRLLRQRAEDLSSVMWFRWEAAQL